jgi:hypothetical protein
MGGRKPRRELIWQLGTLHNDFDMLNLTTKSEPIALPALTQAEKSGMEYHATGISRGPHPLVFYRQQLNQKGILN